MTTKCGCAAGSDQLFTPAAERPPNLDPLGAMSRVR